MTEPADLPRETGVLSSVTASRERGGGSRSLPDQAGDKAFGERGAAARITRPRVLGAAMRQPCNSSM